MDGHGGGAGAGKLTRTPSSLLRSPTVRNCSSFQAVVVEDPEPDDKKAQAHPKAPPHHFHPGAGPAHPLLVLTFPSSYSTAVTGTTSSAWHHRPWQLASVLRHRWCFLFYY